MAKKSNKQILLLLGLIIIVGIIYTFAVQQSFIDGQTITNEERPANWNGYQATLKAAVFGTVTSQPLSNICGTNDLGNLALGNDYVVGDDLELSSYMTSGKWSCQKENYISAEIDLPKGLLEGTCTVSAKSGNQPAEGTSTGGCVVTVPGAETFALGVGACDPNIGCSAESSASEYFAYQLNEPTTVKVLLTDTVSTFGNGNAKIILSFTPEGVETQTPLDDNVPTSPSNQLLGTQTNTATGNVVNDVPVQSSSIFGLILLFVLIGLGGTIIFLLVRKFVLKK